MLVIDTQELDERADKLTDDEIYWTYCALDTCVTYDVLKVIEPQLDDISRATYQTSIATLPVVLEMMFEGLPVDLAARRRSLEHYEAQLAKLEAGFVRLCAEGLGITADRTKRTGGRASLPINPASPKDLQYLFHTVMQIPEKKKRRKGQDEAKVTTDREVLEGFRSYYFAEVFVNFILAMRDAQKAIGFLRTKLDQDNHIRCSFNVAGTTTGRLNSSFSDMGTGTNLQNISGKQKDIFVSDDGWVLVDIDLEQGDSRGVGAIAWNWFVKSRGEDWAGKYLDACESGDLHTTVTQMAWSNLPWTQDPKANRLIAEQLAYRDKSYRDLSKNLGHGSNYLGQPNTMALHAHLPVSIIADFQRNYFSAFECIMEWQLVTIRQLRENRCLITPWGRRRYFWNDPNAVPTHNAAIAYSPQSTTGEFINRGAIALQLYRNKHNLPIRFLLQVHDSLVLMVKRRHLEELLPVILQQLRVILPLEKGREFTIPHGVKVGWNYGMASPDNPFGLSKWKGSDTREPPRRLTSVENLLNTPLR
jgi:DNA polymerase I-like protein with 3'-5' exonuclease and polymerase domains